MGQSQSLIAEIEIQAAPEAVRSIFLEFHRYKEWSHWSIEPVDPTKKPSELKPGDVLNVDLKFMSLKPALEENSHEVFRWEGKVPVLSFLFKGKHQFYFSPSDKHAGGTRFVQAEEFRGLFAFLMKPGRRLYKTTLEHWVKFNEDLKKEVDRALA